MRVESVTFRGSMYNTAEDELRNWTRGMERLDVISVQKNPDGSITLFYWS